MIKIIIAGAAGGMGKTITRLAHQDKEIEIVGAFDKQGNPAVGMDAGDIAGISRIGVKIIEGSYDNLHKLAPKEDVLIDFTEPEATMSFAGFFAGHKTPVVIGTTGLSNQMIGNLKVMSSYNAIVQAPNMAKPIVAFQSLMENLSRKYPGILKGCSLDIIESHQKGKKDTSGTAKAMVEKPGIFNLLGIPFKKDEIIMIREPKEQRELGVPEHALSGHGWHSYIIQNVEKYKHSNGIELLHDELFHFFLSNKKNLFTGYSDTSVKGITTMIDLLENKLKRQIGIYHNTASYYFTSPDKNVGFAHYHDRWPQLLVIMHNVNGRDVYGLGALDAAKWVVNQKPGLYSMQDVLGLSIIEEGK